uniref:Uncharacterized protein n=1 Tax=Aegilops tauschii subsp. strangulata TaxID=200361 RepID=A0A453M463_AEGTS
MTARLLHELRDETNICRLLPQLQCISGRLETKYPSFVARFLYVQARKRMPGTMERMLGRELNFSFPRVGEAPSNEMSLVGDYNSTRVALRITSKSTHVKDHNVSKSKST